VRSQLTLGVIGHVDHGKTALVRALTGIETDRLREERERGLSIVLGFAHLELDHGIVDFIDVPGHEDFIRMMISGATGIDGVLLVVAANESVMPQTREHFAIASLLGIDRGLIAMTKTDLVSNESLTVAEQSVRSAAGGAASASMPPGSMASVLSV
jgi:selenocysteine-specific elongation factor